MPVNFGIMQAIQPPRTIAQLPSSGGEDDGLGGLLSGLQGLIGGLSGMAGGGASAAAGGASSATGGTSNGGSPGNIAASSIAPSAGPVMSGMGGGYSNSTGLFGNRGMMGNPTNLQGQVFKNAQSTLGLREGNPVLNSYLQKANPNLDPSVTPWCAGYVGSVLNASGLKGTGSLAARSYLNYGAPTNNPSIGDIVVLSRGNNPAQGHVGFYAGADRAGNPLVLGGNQGNSVSIKAFDRSQVLGFRTPPLGTQVKSFAQQNNISSPNQLSELPNQINQSYQQKQSPYGLNGQQQPQFSGSNLGGDSGQTPTIPQLPTSLRGGNSPQQPFMQQQSPYGLSGQRNPGMQVGQGAQGYNPDIPEPPTSLNAALSRIPAFQNQNSPYNLQGVKQGIQPVGGNIPTTPGVDIPEPPTSPLMQDQLNYDMQGNRQQPGMIGQALSDFNPQIPNAPEPYYPTLQSYLSNTPRNMDGSVQRMEMAPEAQGYNPDISNMQANPNINPQQPLQLPQSLGGFNNIQPQVAESVQGLMNDLRQQGFQPEIREGFRTSAQQAAKVRAGYSQTNNSRHLTGDAMDIVDKRYGWNTGKYGKEISEYAKAMARTAPKYGLQSGTDWKSFGPNGDFAHVQTPTATQAASLRIVNQATGNPQYPITQTSTGQINNMANKQQVNHYNPSYLPKNAHPELEATMIGIQGVETSSAKNPYTVMSKASKNGDRAYGKYQIMGNNIGPWSKEALGKSVSIKEFLNNPAIQEQVAAYQINKSLAAGYSPQDAASIWFSGRPIKKAGNARDVYGTTVPMYVNKFNKGYELARSKNLQSTQFAGVRN